MDRRSLIRCSVPLVVVIEIALERLTTTERALASLFYLPDEVCTPPAHLYDIVPYSFQ